MRHTLEERESKARELRAAGHNCAQSVLMAFGDVTGLPDDLAARMAMALGAGCAASGEICGVANAMAIAEGLAGDSHPSCKGECTRRANSCIARFRQEEGALRCADLKAPGARKSCEQLILDGIRMLHEHFDNE